jgi:hypothetical protein
MDSLKKFTMYGPKETLKLLGQQLKSETKPQYSFSYKKKDNPDEIYVFIFEEHQKLINSSTTVTLIIKVSNDTAEIDFIITGGRMGFRGSAYSSDNIEPLIQETVNDFLIDFSRRHGLTMQENTVV